MARNQPAQATYASCCVFTTTCSYYTCNQKHKQFPGSRREHDRGSMPFFSSKICRLLLLVQSHKSEIQNPEISVTKSNTSTVQYSLRGCSSSSSCLFFSLEVNNQHCQEEGQDSSNDLASCAFTAWKCRIPANSIS